MTTTEQLWINGEPSDAASARVMALDRGLLYGDGVFETLRLYRGRPFRLDAHLGRLHRGLRFLQITDVPPLHRLERMVMEAAAATDTDAYLRLTVTRGIGGLPSDLRASPRATIIVQVAPLHAQPPERYARGVAAVFAVARRNEFSPLSQHKTLNYLESLLARGDARTQGAYEAILLNTAGDVAEGASSNVFVVSDGGLVTPPTSAGALPGVTRACVLELAGRDGLPVREERITPDRLQGAQEAFLTNSLIELVPLTMVAGRPIGSGVPGPYTLGLAKAYAALVEHETAA